MPRLHVAILDEEIPYPLNSGKRIRTFQLLSRLADRHRLTYLCHRNPDREESEQAERAMRDLGIRTVVVDRRIPSKTGLGFYARLAGNLFASLPYSVSSHRSVELRQAVEKLASQDPPDLWHCEWTPYAESLRHLLPIRECRWVVMAHNVETLIWQRMAETETNPLKRWYIRRQLRKFERFEKWAYSSCDCAIAVSEPDARLMRERFDAGHMAVVDNGVDTAFFAPDPRTGRDPYRMVFVGSLDWRPNLDAVRLLIEEIFPQVRKQEPRTTLDLVGRRPSSWLREQAACVAGVTLYADVADVRPFLHRAGMMVVPLRIGGGSRLKILEALATGLPVISTSIGAEGLRLHASVDLQIADGQEAMVNGIVEWMNDFPSAVESGMSGRQVILENYGWDGLALQLEAIWLRTAGVTMPLQNSHALSSV